MKKANRAIGVAMLVALAMAAGYWLGDQHGSSSARARIAAVSSLRQVGLSFREGRNDLSRFSAP